MKANLEAILENIRTESGSPEAARIILNQSEVIALEVVGPRLAGEAGLSSAHVGGAGTFAYIAAVSHSQDLALALAVNAGSEQDESFEGALREGFKAMAAEFAIG